MSSLSLLALALAAVAHPLRPLDSLEARAAARTCFSLAAPVEESLDGCREAVTLGLHPEWSDVVRLYLARRLATLGQWEEVVDIYRELTDARPQVADWPLRLGTALLFGADRKPEAEAALRQALSRDPRRVEPWAWLGVVLQGSGHPEEALAAFARARALDPVYFDSRPGLSEIEAAARRGEAWP